MPSAFRERARLNRGALLKMSIAAIPLSGDLVERLHHRVGKL